MYRVQDSQLSFYDFLPPYHGELGARTTAGCAWLPPSTGKTLSSSTAPCLPGAARSPFPARVALGSLIVREVYGATDRETVDLIRESPYLQYFIGLKTFGDELPFSYRSMERFRTRIPPQADARDAVKKMRELERQDDRAQTEINQIGHD